jgi:Ca-activated chloride channel family protein
LSLLATTAYSQYYLRGEIKDEKNRPLSNARIFLHSGRSYFFSGASSGGFGINTKQLNDSLTITLDGYENKTVAVKSTQWQTIILKLTADAVSKNQPKLISFTKDLNKTENTHWSESEETYFQLIENDFVSAATYPNTGYSLNVNKASYSNVRRFLNMNSLVYLLMELLFL